MHALFSRLSTIAVTGAALLPAPAAAFAGLGQPTPWQIGMQDAASPVMADIPGFITSCSGSSPRFRCSCWSS